MIITAPEIYRFHYIEVDQFFEEYRGLVWSAPKGDKPLFTSEPFPTQQRAHGAAKRFIDQARRKENHHV